jgi:general transcription factor 3C polypeptide 5 (transcription factor C subunit 1)
MEFNTEEMQHDYSGHHHSSASYEKSDTKFGTTEASEACETATNYAEVQRDSGLEGDDDEEIWEDDESDDDDESQDDEGSEDEEQSDGEQVSDSNNRSGLNNIGWYEYPVPLSCDPHTAPPSIEGIIADINDLLDDRPVATIRYIRARLEHRTAEEIQAAVRYCGYEFRSGPWKKAIVQFGYDPRRVPIARFYQTVVFDMNFNPVVDINEWPERRKELLRKYEGNLKLAFPQFLPASDNIPYCFNGKKFRTDDNIWQICDIEDGLLRKIIETTDIRGRATEQHGFFWNGTIAKLMIIMRHKIINIRDGRVLTDDEFSPLLAFPDNYTPLKRDPIRYGLEFGKLYTKAQKYLMSRIKEEAKRLPRTDLVKAERQFERLMGEALGV